MTKLARFLVNPQRWQTKERQRLVEACFSDPAITRLFQALPELLLVGGAVRDIIMQKAPLDLDFCIPYPPEHCIALLEQAGIRYKPTGLQHGTISAIIGKKSYEITSWRFDQQHDGRHAQVVYTQDLMQDALRRDFSMNALYMDQAGQLYDPLGSALADCERKALRFIGDGQARIDQDHLRLLRYFRFAARFGTTQLAAQDIALCARNAGHLARLSGERIWQELKKLLMAEHASEVIALIDQHSIMNDFWPQTGGAARVASILGHPKARTLAQPALLLRAMLGEAQALSVTAKNLAKRLALSQAETFSLCAALPNLPESCDLQDWRCALYKQNKQHMIDACLLAHRFEQAEMLVALVAPIFEITGQDLMDFGLAQGPALGQKLHALEQQWLQSKATLSRHALLEMLKEDL